MDINNPNLNPNSIYLTLFFNLLWSPPMIAFEGVGTSVGPDELRTGNASC